MALPDESAVLHGKSVGDTTGRTELMLRRFWEPPRELEDRTGEGGHGGGDVRMLAALFGEPAPDPLGRAADAVDGARSLVTGLAANLSLRPLHARPTARAVRHRLARPVVTALSTTP